MDRGIGNVLAPALAALLLAGCATTQETRPQEGQVIFQAGDAGSPPTDARIVPGPTIHHLGVLIPTSDPPWQALWLDTDKDEKKKMTGRGAFSGFLFGLGVVSSMPISLVAWPVAAGVVAGTTAMGLLGQEMDTSAPSRVEIGDREALREAAATLYPDHLLRESLAAALAGRIGRPPFPVAWQPPRGPDTPGTNPMAEARKAGADGVLDLTVEAFGLAMGEDSESYGVFVRVRAQLIEVGSGRLRYERVLQHGPGRPMAGMPRPAEYSLEFLALDKARVFRHELREVLVRMAAILARDTALPLGPS
jgi:hypothetical protein